MVRNQTTENGPLSNDEPTMRGRLSLVDPWPVRTADDTTPGPRGAGGFGDAPGPERLQQTPELGRVHDDPSGRTGETRHFDTPSPGRHTASHSCQGDRLASADFEKQEC